VSAQRRDGKAAAGDAVPRQEGEEAVVHSGEVWTDARGYATVLLPRSFQVARGGLEYELRPCPRHIKATVAAQLVDGRFTIATDEPHVKVRWQVTGQRRRHLESVP
jgi:hypothetical protein